jgi:hypothetical protein
MKIVQLWTPKRQYSTCKKQGTFCGPREVHRPPTAARRKRELRTSSPKFRVTNSFTDSSFSGIGSSNKKISPCAPGLEFNMGTKYAGGIWVRHSSDIQPCHTFGKNDVKWCKWNHNNSAWRTLEFDGPSPWAGQTQQYHIPSIGTIDGLHRKTPKESNG